MTITKRTLERWRKEALLDINGLSRLALPTDKAPLTKLERTMLDERILRLTGELLDLHLMKERKS